MIPSKSFEPDMKYWQVEHKGWFHPNVLNQTSTDKLNIQEDSIQKFGIRQEEQTSWTYRVIWSKSFVPDIKYWQVEHTGWFNTKVLNQTWSIDKLNIQGDSIQKFSTRHEEQTIWTYRVILSKVVNQTWSTDKLNIQGDSIQVLNQTWSTDKLNIWCDSI